MNAPLQIRLAVRTDDDALCRLMLDVGMPGQMELAASYTPSFFAAIEVEGERSHVIVEEQNGKLVGCGLAAERNVYLNGAATRVGYLSSLRLEPGTRSSTALARGYRFLRGLQPQQNSVPFSLSTIMNGNIHAVKMLSSGRADLPRYIRCGSYTSYVLAPGRRPKMAEYGPLRIRTGAELGPDTLCGLLHEWGSHRQFYPVYTAADLIAPDGILRGLSLEHFLVAMDRHEQPVGLLACWDQMPFRRHIVKRYHGMLRVLHPLARIAGHALGHATLPSVGKPVSCLYAACMAVRHDDPDVFDCLLRQALVKTHELQRDYLFVGLADGDPLAPRARRLAHLCLHSGIYMVGWGLAPDAVATLDGRPLYLELGSL